MAKQRVATRKARLMDLFGLRGKGDDEVLRHVVNGLSDRLLLRVMESLSKEKQIEFLVVVNSKKPVKTVIQWIAENVPDFFGWLRKEVDDVRKKQGG